MPKKSGGSPKVPFKVLQGIRKKTKEREIRKREWARETGGYVIKKKKRKDPFNPHGDGQIRQALGDRRGIRNIADGSRGLKPAVGTYSEGILYLSKKDIEDINGASKSKSKKLKDTVDKPKGVSKHRKGKKGKGKKGKKKKRRG